jgi:hypothetical protein
MYPADLMRFSRDNAALDFYLELDGINMEYYYRSNMGIDTKFQT